MSASPATAGVPNGDDDEFEGLLDQFLDGGVNYLSPLPLDVLRHICINAADAEDVWRKRTLREFWSESNGKPPAQWKLYYRHWYSVKCFWKNTNGLMSFLYKSLEWSSFNPDLSGYMVCETNTFVRTTRYVNLRKAKSYTLRETNQSPGAPPMSSNPTHAWSKHVFAVADNPEATNDVQLLDVGEGAVIVPPPPLHAPNYNSDVSVTALLWAGSVLVIGHRCGSIRAYNIIPHAEIHPVVPFRGYNPTLPVLSLILLEPGRIAALSSAGIRVFVAEVDGYHCSQVIDIAPFALETFIPSGIRFVSYAGRLVQTWELSPQLKVVETLDLSTLTDMPDAIGVVAADEDSLLVSADDTLLHVRLRPLQLMRRVRFHNSSIVAVSLDGPIAAVVQHKHDLGTSLLIMNMYTGQVLHQSWTSSVSVRWLQLSGKELALIEPTSVKYWRDGYVVPNKKMRVKQNLTF